MTARIGVDIGGTFTDIVIYDPSTGMFQATKTPSTPDQFERGVINGIWKALDISGREPGEISFLSHATTVATNAVLEENLPNVGLITNEGFSDVLEIGKQIRPDPFDLQVDKPPALVPRELRKEVPGRIDADGNVTEPLDEDQVDDVIREFAEQDVESVVVSMLFSFLNDEQERRIGDHSAAHGLEYALASDVHPERREYERTVTTVINESTKQVIEEYLERAESGISDLGIDTSMTVMHCGGGIFSVDQAIQNAARTITSGPAAGAVATETISALEGFDNAIGFDMGGTSADVSIVHNGEIVRTTENEINDLPIEIPMVDIATVGAGGGSIARVDSGGALRVGPESAGASPGPVCYGQGGERPTITDANLLLGRLNPARSISGEIDLDKQRTERLFTELIAEPLDLSAEEAALSVLQVANTRLVRNTRKATIERGYDPKGFALVAFGGMGPQMAAAVADEMDIKTIVVPRNPGMLSAQGLLTADVRVQEARSYREQEVDPATVIDGFAELEDDVETRMTKQEFEIEDIELVYNMDMRYVGQAYELTVPVTEGELGEADIETSLVDFHDQHERRYGYAVRDNPVRVTTLRVTGRVPTEDIVPGVQTTDEEPYRETRDVYFAEQGYVSTDVYDREAINLGRAIDGPAIVEEKGSTTIIPPEWTASVSDNGTIVVRT